MDPVHPWVDPSEMRRLAEALLVVPEPAPKAPDDAGFGGDFVGFAGSTRVEKDGAGPLHSSDELVPQPLLHVAPEPVTPDAVVMERPVIVPPAPLQPFQFNAPVQQQHVPVGDVTNSTLIAPQDRSVTSQDRTATSHDRSMAEQIASASRLAKAAKQAAVREVSLDQHQQPSFPPFSPPSVPPPMVETPQPLPPPPQVLPPPPAAPALHYTAPVKVRGPFLERMARFRAGLHHQFAAKGVFVLDKEGAVIFDEGDHSRLHFMARSLAMAARKNSDGPGNVHVKVGSTTTLEVIPVETVFGRMVLGLLMEQPLPPSAVPLIIQTLQLTVAPPTQP